MSRAVKNAPRRKLVKDDAVLDALYKAAIAYIEKRGGSATVVGGISIVQFPDDMPYSYTLGIRVMGSKPRFAWEPKQ